MLIACIIFALLSVCLVGILTWVAVKTKRRVRLLLSEKAMLEAINHKKIEIFQDISHDLKTPLIVISTTLHNLTDMIELNEVDEDEMTLGLKNAQSEVMRLSRMADSALRLSLFSDNSLEMVLLDMTEVLREVAGIYRTLLGIRNNTLHVDVPALLPKVKGSRDLLVHVLVNLLSNANKYTSSDEISIKAAVQGGLTSKERGCVAVFVSDNGAGIKPELLNRVFERGVSDGATGIGLSICKTVIEDTHGGVISIESQVGQGTTVKFTLPIELP